MGSGHELEERFETFYREREDPWDYWVSEYEIKKYREQISLVSQYQSPRHILEIACSTGAHTKLIHEAFPNAKITAVDISPTAVARAKRNVRFQGIEFRVADIFEFSKTLGNASIDAIFWSEGFDFLHDHCTIGAFSELARNLNLCLRSEGVLCISHAVPHPLSYPPIDAGRKNVRVFHDLIGDYFHRAAHLNNTLRKSEIDTVYRYDTTLYRPRLLSSPIAATEAVSVNRVDIVIPARDEAKTIGSVISKMRLAARVDTIVVVDNGSADETAAVAAAAGARVVSCPNRGYGRAVKRGTEECQQPWILKLDADMKNATPDWVDRLADVATAEQCRLVKTHWPPADDDANRVTDFTARPALKIFFPELLHIRSPLSGIYLFHKTSFDLSQLPNDFSFDVAMLIAALQGGHKIREALIESVRHSTVSNGERTFEHYFNMSDEVLRCIVRAGLERFQ
jgi:SAM-dependent methyltransferase